MNTNLLPTVSKAVSDSLTPLIEDADKSDTVAVPPRNIDSATITGVNKDCFLNELRGHQSIIGSTKWGLHWDHVNVTEQNLTSVGDFSFESGTQWDYVNDVSTELGQSSAYDLSCGLGSGYTMPCDRQQSWGFPVTNLSHGWTSID